MAAIKPSPAQVAGHTYFTRGMSKSAVPFAEQITAGRSDAQTTTRAPRPCVTCLGERDSKFPICTNCQNTRGL